MKILMVHPHEVYSSSEPWTTRIVNLAKALIKKSHEVRIVFFPLRWQGEEECFQKEGICFYPFCRRAGVLNIARNTKKMSGLADWADIVHFQKCFHYGSLPSIISAFLKNKPLHYDWDDWEEMIYYESADPPIKAIGMFLKTLETYIPQIADTVSVSSRRLHNLARSFGIGNDRIFHVPVGADLDKFNPGISGERVRRAYGINSPLILYLGQLHGGQYVRLFIDAAKIILDRGIMVNFMIVGDGSRAQELKQYAKGRNLDEKIIFTGAVDSGEVPEYIAACDVAVACFEDNSATCCKSPLKIAEYLASGKPMVASKVGEVESMVGEAGIL
ncbi:glycosyltransferase, partial [bacterium]